MEKDRIEIIYKNIDNVKMKMLKIDLEACILLNLSYKISLKEYTYTTLFGDEIKI